MAYILDILDGGKEPSPDKITLSRYVREQSYITKYLSRVVKDKALVIYEVLFRLTYFETGGSEITIPWAKVGSFITSDQGNIIDDNTTVKRRLGGLLKNECIIVTRQRSGANQILVRLPSEIKACKKLIETEEILSATPPPDPHLDYYNNPQRRLEILTRDQHRCTYCQIELTEDSFFLDHLIPNSQKGGTHYKNNLVSSCESCNGRKGDQEAIEFLLSNYRTGLLKQAEFLQQRSVIEELLKSQNI
ncbi:MAG: HNH endonuclease [Verrucomicrobiota bacterium]|jgi:hypothetical protein